MAGNISNYLELKLLAHSVGQADFAAPVDTFAALFLVAPTDSTTGTEVSAGNYQRSGSPGRADPISWGAPASGAIANNADIDFGTADANWGTVVALGIFDQLTTGNLLWYGTLGNTVTINTTDSYKITSGGLTLALD